MTRSTLPPEGDEPRAATRALVLAGLLPFLLHCGASRPEVRHYTLSVPPPAPSATEAATKTLQVRHLLARAPYDQQLMVYRSTPYRVAFYNYHQWASSPGEQVAEWTLRYLRQSGLFAQVMAAPGTSGELVLGGVIRDFEEVDGDGAWEAVLGVDFYLTKGDQQPPLWSKSFQVRRAAARRNPEAIAEAMSQNLEQVLKQVTQDLAPFAR